MEKINSGDIQIEAAKLDEGPFLSELALRSKSIWDYSEDYLKDCRQALTVEVNTIVNWPVFVARRAGRELGFYSLMQVKGEPRLDNLWIEPQYIKCGVGSLLFKHSVDQAKKLGWTSFHIVADCYAEKFYQKFGAVKVGMVQSKIREDIRLPHYHYLFD
ncbi:MAG: GNAT family N-acetyltransferase [Halobacteriovoraceae bacterium]|jgi:GNAT superfamily N-acetyltransferase|nr:GNAT family N-acetyltransferase [Halobacteriovoraceae bacterium]MBT5093689.1 GNAT family N-acetyltransferase [Halobacteriovoraceae bacterium]